MGLALVSVFRWDGGWGLSPWHSALGAFAAGGLAGYFLVSALRPGVRERRFALALVLGAAALSRLAGMGSPYLGLWGLAASLGALFCGSRFGILILIPLAAWGGPALGVGPTTVGLSTGLSLAALVARVRKGRDLLLAGVISGGIGGAVAAFLYPHAGWMGILSAALSGPLVAILSWALIPLVERVLDRTSPLTLVELLDPSHPLLERMRREAPGTYYHSRNVSALAEAAAKAIGADALLAAVGGLYHDIGKLFRPNFFVENQDGSNPHDQLSPSLSKVVLASHVKEGVRLARQYGLKGDIIAFIATHHGTSVMRYFYEKGVAQGLSEDDFRYTSPLPDTKETAIVMLADPLEAAARTARKEELGELVEQVVEERRRDGQLDHAPLTMADLAKVKHAFQKVLQGMVHQRVPDYPLYQGQ